MNLLGAYTNGNYRVRIYEDGTKIRETVDSAATEFIPEFPESFDFKITNHCTLNCPYCHEDSTPTGQHGDLRAAMAGFLSSLPPYTEIAIGGGNPLSHPDLVPFLNFLHERKIIANMTVNQIHFMKYRDMLLDLMKRNLIHGLGVSLVNADPIFVDAVKGVPNLVIHAIVGILTKEQLNALADKELNLLILGYKNLRRGQVHMADPNSMVFERLSELYDLLPKYLKAFRCISFDNLAIDQMDVRRLIPGPRWSTFYMGEDGSHTMYVDLPSNQYSISSTHPKRWSISPTIHEMFQTVRTEAT